MLPGRWPISVRFFRKAMSGKARKDGHCCRQLEELLTEKIKPIWPSTAQGSGGAEPFVIKSYVQANFEGSDRYTLSLPVSPSHRISPLIRRWPTWPWLATGPHQGWMQAASKAP